MEPLERKNELFKKALQDRCSAEELQELYRLVALHGTHEELEAMLEKGWHTLDSSIKLDEDSSREVLQKINAHIQRKLVQRHYTALLRVAASVLLLIGSYYVFESFKSTFFAKPEGRYLVHYTPAGAMDSIKLEDGTTVWLNADSKLEYPKSFGKQNRTVFLSGEAFFDVAKEKERPFIIHTGALRTTVLGTSFNVKAYNEERFIQVTVATGKVLVESDSSSTDKTRQAQPVYLVPGKQVAFDKDSRSFSTTDALTADVSDWRKGGIPLDGRMREAALVLSRRFNMKVVFDNDALNDCRIRANYNNQDLIGVLNSIKYILDINYVVAGDTIRLSGAGCHEVPE